MTRWLLPALALVLLVVVPLAFATPQWGDTPQPANGGTAVEVTGLGGGRVPGAVEFPISPINNPPPLNQGLMWGTHPLPHGHQNPGTWSYDDHNANSTLGYYVEFMTGDNGTVWAREIHNPGYPEPITIKFFRVYPD